MRIITIISSLLFTALCNAQTVIVNNKPGLNSAETEMQVRLANQYGALADSLLKKGDNEKAYYYIKQWAHTHILSARYYILLAEYNIKIGNKRAAKKYLRIAYKKFGCYECKERAAKL